MQQKDYLKRNTDPILKLKDRLRNNIKDSFKIKKYIKGKKLEEIVGLNINELVEYLLNTFVQNYGYEYAGQEPVHIDHIKPLATATTVLEVEKLCHYTNLQLLKAKDNLQKGAKY